MGMRYTRAVPTRDCHAIVYAHRLTRQDAVGNLLDEKHFVLHMCGDRPHRQLDSLASPERGV